jgi:hypothetical protein
MPKKKPVEKNRGHWRKGVRRNDDGGDWSRTMTDLKKLVEQHWIRGKISYQACASAIGVHPTTVARWRDGTDRPPVEVQELVGQWIADRRKELADIQPQ